MPTLLPTFNSCSFLMLHSRDTSFTSDYQQSSHQRIPLLKTCMQDFVLAEQKRSLVKLVTMCRLKLDDVSTPAKGSVFAHISPLCWNWCHVKLGSMPWLMWVAQCCISVDKEGMLVHIPTLVTTTVILSCWYVLLHSITLHAFTDASTVAHGLPRPALRPHDSWPPQPHSPCIGYWFAWLLFLFALGFHQAYISLEKHVCFTSSYIDFNLLSHPYLYLT